MFHLATDDVQRYTVSTTVERGLKTTGTRRHMKVCKGVSKFKSYTELI
jgi:hypothetical protein